MRCSARSAAGDIGRRTFPDTDAGVQGCRQPRAAAARLAACALVAGFVLGNVDATIVAQAPRLAPYIAADGREHRRRSRMRRPSQVNVKATTTEGLGFTGRGEGIAAMVDARAGLRSAGSSTPAGMRHAAPACRRLRVASTVEACRRASAQCARRSRARVRHRPAPLRAGIAAGERTLQAVDLARPECRGRDRATSITTDVPARCVAIVDRRACRSAARCRSDCRQQARHRGGAQRQRRKVAGAERELRCRRGGSARASGATISLSGAHLQSRHRDRRARSRETGR